MVQTLRLIVEAGPGVGQEAVFLLTGHDGLVGRDPQCDLVIESPTVSSRHGMLECTAAGYRFTDLNSSNGSAIERAGAPLALTAGAPTPVAPGDVLLLGAADAPVRIRVEAGAAPFQAGPRTERTVLATAPLSDLVRTGDGLTGLAARAIAARTPEALATVALRWLTERLPDAAGHSVQISGAGFTATAGDVAPTGLAREAASKRQVVVFQESGEALPQTESIARAGLQAAIVAPLLTGDSWHGLMAAWTSDGDALPGDGPILDALSVGASLVALSAAALAVRLEGEAERDRLAAENRALRGQEKLDPRVIDPIGSAPSFVQAVELCRTVAPAGVPVLLLGETGTGKEVLARSLHRWSPRADRAFVAFNCAAVPETLLESELFGHVRGAFTGAARDKKGLFEEADGGTVFLDEIGEMPAPMQAKLLRVLQDGEVRRVGANRATVVDVRVISATHRDLRAHVEQGTFRADLMYRLNAVTVRVPPLRERADDIGLLAHVLLGKHCRKSNKRLPGFSPEALWALNAHEFPGNVRELENEVIRAVALTPEGQPVAPEVLSEAIARRQNGGTSPDGIGAPTAPHFVPVGPEPLKRTVERAERSAVDAALQRTGGNVSAAARELGLTRPGLYKVMERLGLRG